MSNDYRQEPRSEWVARGACSVEFAPFYEDDYESCKQVCRHCPVIDQCLMYAIANGEKWFVWGGMTPAERTAYKKRVDVSHVPKEYRAHYLGMEDRVKRTRPAPQYQRNPALDYHPDPDFLELLANFG